MDHVAQPNYTARYGGQWFALGDAVDAAALRTLVRKHRPIGVIASPPCESYSTATFAGAPSHAPRLIALVRELLGELDLPFIIENVMGASSEMLSHAIVLRGQQFGLETSRPRFFEPGGGLELRVDEALAEGGRALAARSCLGARRRFSGLDSHGMPVRGACCSGNIYAVQGSEPWGCTSEQAAGRQAPPHTGARHNPHH